jgi:D-glycero-D-manno-heptose 1,7-bisphosphate phosphatase
MTDLATATPRSQPGATRFAAVLLDRDGTINLKAPEGRYITSPGELVLLPGAAAAIRQLNAASVQVILVTNQRWLSTRTDLTAYERVHARLEELLAENGAHLDGAYYCPHASGSCHCRKPAPGMLERAAQERLLSLTEAVMIGDRASDIEAGRAAGTATILLSTTPDPFSRADFVVANLAQAVRLILGDRSRPQPVKSGSPSCELCSLPTSIIRSSAACKAMWPRCRRDSWSSATLLLSSRFSPAACPRKRPSTGFGSSA